MRKRKAEATWILQSLEISTAQSNRAHSSLSLENDILFGINALIQKHGQVVKRAKRWNNSPFAIGNLLGDLLSSCESGLFAHRILQKLKAELVRRRENR